MSYKEVCDPYGKEVRVNRSHSKRSRSEIAKAERRCCVQGFI